MRSETQQSTGSMWYSDSHSLPCLTDTSATMCVLRCRLFLICSASLFSNVLECSRMFSNVLECSRMFSNVLEVLPPALRCISTGAHGSPVCPARRSSQLLTPQIQHSPTTKLG